MQPRMAMNEAQHKTVHLLKTFFFFCSSVFISVCVFSVWLKTTLLPVWPRDDKRLDIPVPRQSARCLSEMAHLIIMKKKEHRRYDYHSANEQTKAENGKGHAQSY